MLCCGPGACRPQSCSRARRSAVGSLRPLKGGEAAGAAGAATMDCMPRSGRMSLPLKLTRLLCGSLTGSPSGREPHAPFPPRKGDTGVGAAAAHSVGGRSDGQSPGCRLALSGLLL